MFNHNHFMALFQLIWRVERDGCWLMMDLPVDADGEDADEECDEDRCGNSSR